MTPNLTEREAFEAWAGPLEYDLRPMCDPREFWGDEYISPSTANVWFAFQAGAAWGAQAPDPLTTQEKPNGLP